jgi:hypothetical protein
MNMRFLIVAGLALSFAGCMGAVLPYNPEKMQADQIKALVADKNASVTCATTDTPYKGNVIHLNLDKGVVVHGEVTVNRDCSVTIKQLGTGKPVPLAPTP